MVDLGNGIGRSTCTYCDCARGRMVTTSRLAGVKYVDATRWMSAAVTSAKISNSPSAVRMSLWMTTACAS